MDFIDKDARLVKMTYVPQAHTFDVELTYAGQIGNITKRLNYRNFPNHKPLKFLNGKFQINQEVKVWIKDEKELKKNEWDFLSKKGKTLGNKEQPFTIGPKKGKFLGGKAVRGFIGINAKMVPYVVVKDGDKYWRFSEGEIRFIMALQASNVAGKNASLMGNGGYEWVYDTSRQEIRSPIVNLQGEHVQDLIILLRKAELI